LRGFGPAFGYLPRFKPGRLVILKNKGKSMSTLIVWTKAARHSHWTGAVAGDDYASREAFSIQKVKPPTAPHSRAGMRFARSHQDGRFAWKYEYTLFTRLLKADGFCRRVGNRFKSLDEAKAAAHEVARDCGR
jgi:hypothetical protein